MSKYEQLVLIKNKGESEILFVSGFWLVIIINDHQ